MEWPERVLMFSRLSCRCSDARVGILILLHPWITGLPQGEVFEDDLDLVFVAISRLIRDERIRESRDSVILE